MLTGDGSLSRKRWVVPASGWELYKLAASMASELCSHGEDQRKPLLLGRGRFQVLYRKVDICTVSEGSEFRGEVQRHVWGRSQVRGCE